MSLDSDAMQNYPPPTRLGDLNAMVAREKGLKAVADEIMSKALRLHDPSRLDQKAAVTSVSSDDLGVQAGRHVLADLVDRADDPRPGARRVCHRTAVHSDPQTIADDRLASAWVGEGLRGVLCDSTDTP